MKIAEVDHTNWRVKDLERSLQFYRDFLGLEPIGIEEHRRGERPLVAVRVTPTFIMHLWPDAGIEVERRSDGVWGARGEGTAIYVRDPDGYLIELKIYGA